MDTEELFNSRVTEIVLMMNKTTPLRSFKKEDSNRVPCTDIAEISTLSMKASLR